MTQDDITHLWQLSMNDAEGMRLGFTTQQHYFAALVAAAEREACAKVCDGKVEAEYATGKVDHNEMAWTQSCAIDIRARGEK